MAALMLFAIESHSSSQRPCPNQSTQPTQHFVAATEIMRSLVFKVLGWLVSFSLGGTILELLRCNRAESLRRSYMRRI